MSAPKPTRDFPYGWEMAFAWCPAPDTTASQTSTPHVDDSQSKVTRRYDRMAWLYDLYDAPMEWMGTRRRRRRLISRTRGNVLEVGIGTGKNLDVYPLEQVVNGIDISERMLARASSRAERLGSTVRLQVADVTRLPFADDTFDTTVATSVFCSVADPVGGLREVRRVTKPDGRILLLEHVRPQNPVMGWLSDVATVFTRRIFGFRANRRTEENVEAAGLHITSILKEGVWREIEASPQQRPTRQGDPA